MHATTDRALSVDIDRLDEIEILSGPARNVQVIFDTYDRVP